MPSPRPHLAATATAAAAAGPPQQLSLFDDGPTAPAHKPAPGAAQPSPHANVANNAAAAPPTLAAPVAWGAPADSSPSLLRHPQAQHRIHLGEHELHYHWRRTRRRSIGFVVDAEGLSVSAPRWVRLADIEAALREKSAWVLRKLHEQQERARRVAQQRIVWRDGTSFPFLGETVILVLDPRVSGAVLHDAQALPGVAHLTLHLGLPQDANAQQIRDGVQSWLQRQARRVFEERCALYAPRLGVQVTRLGLSSASTRWGSASLDGSIRLHWRLVHCSMAVIDYVVTHELAHLKEMNHSPRFWSVVRSVLPDYESRRAVLRAQVLPEFET